MALRGHFLRLANTEQHTAIREICIAVSILMHTYLEISNT